MIDIQHGQQQLAAVALPARHFDFQTLAPGGAVRQLGQRIDQGQLALLFETLTQATGRLLEARHTPHELLQALTQLVFMLAVSLLVGVGGCQQPIQARAHRLFQARQVIGLEHAVAQPTDMLVQLVVEHPGRFLALRDTLMGGGQIVLHRRQALIERLQVVLELALALAGGGTHQHGQVIEYRDQLVPVEPPLDPFTKRSRLRPVRFGQLQIVEQAEQGGLDMLGDRAVRLFGHHRQRIMAFVERRVCSWLLLGFLRRGRFGLIEQGRRHRQVVEQQRPVEIVSPRCGANDLSRFGPFRMRLRHLRDRRLGHLFGQRSLTMAEQALQQTIRTFLGRILNGQRLRLKPGQLTEQRRQLARLGGALFSLPGITLQ